MSNTISHDLIENRTIYPIMKAEKDKYMTITATEFKKNFGKYLELASKEDILITRNGKTIAKLSSPNDIEAKLKILESMVGAMLPKDGSKPLTLEEARDERLKRQ